MALLILMGAFALLLILGVPVAFALGAASVATFWAMDLPPIIAFQRMASGLNIFALMAIPFFIFTGDLMGRAGIAARLVALASALFGRTRGGLAQVTVGASALFGAVSGSAVASVSALGSTLIPQMKEAGYGADYAVNVTATAAILGILIPPSHNMIIYASAAGAGVSVGDLFLAGVLPGLVTWAALALAAWAVAKRRNYARGRFPGLGPFVRAAVRALPGLMTAVLIFVGILAGVFTPTESAAVAVVYTLLVATLVYRSLGWRDFLAAAAASVRTTAMVMLIIATASAFGWLLAVNHAPEALADLLGPIADNPILLLLAINLILLLLGTFMDMAPLIIITTPIFLPLAMAAGVDPVQFGMLMMLNLGIGLVTPPVGSVLFVGAAVGGIRIEQAVASIWPFYLALVAALLAITFVPQLSLWLPGVMR
jgi:tripartite ATP-independent transporter DctM subunit